MATATPSSLSLDEVRAALAGALRPTQLNALASGPHAGPLLLASELGQHTGSFKARGALGAARFSTASHLLTASSGNFGAALAWAAAGAGRRCTVVMPDNSLERKVAAVRAHGAAVELIDTARISRVDRLRQLAAETPDSEAISPFDDERVIFGNATLGFEILAAMPTLDAILVPIGGGGIAAGLCVARDALGLPTQIYGCEPALGDDAARSLAAGRIIANPAEPATICDGARTISLGVRNFAILQRGLAGIFVVDDAAIHRALPDLAALGLAAEPTGALGFAALQQNSTVLHRRSVACVVSGGNRAGIAPLPLSPA